jgi:hypothetical protein
MCYLTTLPLANILLRNVSCEGMDVYDTDSGKCSIRKLTLSKRQLCPTQIPHILAHCWALAYTPPDTWCSLILSHPLILCFLFFHFFLYIFTLFLLYLGDRGSTVVKVLRYKSNGVNGIFHWYKSFCSHYGPGVTQPVTEMSTRSISWRGKCGRCVRLTTLTPSCAVVKKSGKP